MKHFFLFICLLIPFFVVAQNIGDTIVVPTINYSQTHSPNGRDTMIYFPDDPTQSYEKIIMAYNMRCKDGLVSVPGNTNRGCGEWDYKCNTFVTDSSRVDSIISYHPSHRISHFSGDTFYYVQSPMHDYYQYLQYHVGLNQIISEIQAPVGAGSLWLDEVLPVDHFSGKSQYLFTQAELIQAGASAGNLDGIILKVESPGTASFLKLKIKHTSASTLDNSAPDLEGFTEVYFSDHDFAAGDNRIQFYTPFAWDGSSNIIVEFSFTNTNPASPLLLQGNDTGEDYGLHTIDGTHIINDQGYTQIPVAPLASISSEITVSLWCYGSPDFLPANTSIIHGNNSSNQRSFNVHLPWSNSGVYFDCGYEGGYDRIDKIATASEIAGQWNHWAFTKNAGTGEMKIFLNGQLWHSGSGKTNLIEIEDLVLGFAQNTGNYYYGKIDELRIWNVELDEAAIAAWMNVAINENHPNYANLVAYYKANEGSGTNLEDSSPYGQTAQIHDFVIWGKERGSQLSRNFEATGLRPNLTFLQGEYDLTITDNVVNVADQKMTKALTQYEIIPRYGTMLNDSIHPVSTQYVWEAGYQYTYNPQGVPIDSTLVNPTSYATISELNYYRRYPAKYEIMSFVTPYGIYLDLGLEGKTWLFDLTDYAPVLKGWKRLSVELGGQRQEDMDIQFWFVVGTPPRDVIDINQLWRASSSNFTNLMNDRAFEPRTLTMNPDALSYKVRSVITGHGQQGEFSQRWHSLNIDEGIPEFEWQVWTECSTVPIYPQGGTWIFDRAGWCPGDPSDLHEWDITEFVSPGQSHTIDYDLTYASGDANYQVNNQLVSYGGRNFTLDAAIINIVQANADNAAFERFNPACSNPVVVIQNTGSSVLSSLDIEYFVEGGQVLTYAWSGSLRFLESEEVELDIPGYDFWVGSSNTFNVNISNANGQTDDYEYNNHYASKFNTVDIYDDSETLTIECKTNNQGYQTSYALTDLDGNVIFEMSGLDNATVYTNEVSLPLGCYQLRIDDTGDNGLYFWYTPNYGTGYLRVKDSEGNILYDFEPEFGRFAIYEFGIVDITGTEEWLNDPNIISVYPNPATDFISISLEGMESNVIDALLFDASQAVVFKEQFCVEDNHFTKNIAIEGLSAGVYFLQLQYNDHKILRKIVKQ